MSVGNFDLEPVNRSTSVSRFIRNVEEGFLCYTLMFVASGCFFLDLAIATYLINTLCFNEKIIYSSLVICGIFTLKYVLIGFYIRLKELIKA